MLNEVKSTSTFGRSLQILLLAFCGLLFYAGVIFLLGFAGAFVLSAYAHTSTQAAPDAIIRPWTGGACETPVVRSSPGTTA
jgi:hypothetical protein